MASNNAILLPVNFDVSKISFGVPKNLDNGGKIIPIAYEGRPLVLQTPKLTTPYGANRWDNDRGGGGVKISIDLSFGNPAENPELKPFFEMVKELNKLFIDEAFKNSNAWFKKKYVNTEVIEALYTSLIKYSKDKVTGEPSTTYPPTFKVQLPQRDGNYTFQVYDAQKQQIDFDAVDMKGGEILSIIQCTGVWVAGGKFGCSWKAVQLKVWPRMSKLMPFAFVDEVEDDE
jgi:hypothetical protein